MLTPELLELLETAAGTRLLALAEALADDPFAAQRLRAEEPGSSAELAAAAVDQVRFRKRGAGKFSRAGELWYSAPLLEQASGEAAARCRSLRFRRWDRVADLCCGLGIDAAALAAHTQVLAVDRDPLALALTRRTAAVYGVRARVTTVAGELPAAAPEVEAAWVDPGRREGGVRNRRLEAISPPLSQLLALRSRIPHLGIKLSPASSHEELDEALHGIPHERELLSVGGECRELALWTGALAGEHAGEPGGVRRATLISEADGASSSVSLVGVPEPLGEVEPAGAWLLEPNSAVIRAGLVGNLSRELNAWPIDSRLAYLSVNSPVETPFARQFRVEKPEPFSLKQLGRRLRELEAGDVVLKTRGVVTSPEELRQQLRRVLKQGRPGRCPVVFITRLDGRAMMILGASFGPGAG